MANAPQNPAQKTQDERYSSQSNQGATPGQKDQNKATDRNAIQLKDGKSADANKAGGMKNNPQGSDTRREREEEDLPRATNKAGTK